MSDFKPGDINTDTGPVYQPIGKAMPLCAFRQVIMLFCPENLGLQVFRVFHCPDVKHTEAWKSKNATKSTKYSANTQKTTQSIDIRCPKTI